MKNISSNKIALNLFMINAFIYIAASQYNPFLSSYYSKSGISAVQIGILTTIGPIVSILIQPFWALLSDRTGKRKLVLSIVVLGTALSIFSFYLGHTFPTFFIAALLLAIFATSIVPLSDALSLQNAAKYQLDFSKIRMGGTIGFAIAVNFAGAIIKQKPSMSFLLGSLGYFFLLFFVTRLPKEEGTESSKKKECDYASDTADKTLVAPSPSKQKTSLFHIFESKQVYFVLAFAFISMVGLSFNFNFLGVYMINMGMTERTIGLVNSIAAFTELPVLFLINRLIKKYSTITLALFACVMLTIRILAITGGSLPYVIFSMLLHGMSYMTIYYSCAVFISKNVKPENQSRGQSILAVIQTGLGSIAGNIFGGFLVDHLGLKSAYQIMAAFVLISAIILALGYYIVQGIQRKRVMN